MYYLYYIRCIVLYNIYIIYHISCIISYIISNGHVKDPWPFPRQEDTRNVDDSGMENGKFIGKLWETIRKYYGKLPFE